MDQSQMKSLRKQQSIVAYLADNPGIASHIYTIQQMGDRIAVIVHVEHSKSAPLNGYRVTKISYTLYDMIHEYDHWQSLKKQISLYDTAAEMLVVCIETSPVPLVPKRNRTVCSLNPITTKKVASVASDREYVVELYKLCFVDILARTR